MTERRSAAKARRIQQVKRQIFMIAVVTIVIVSGIGIYLTKMKHQTEAAVTTSAETELEKDEAISTEADITNNNVEESTEKNQKEIKVIEIETEQKSEIVETPKERLKRVKREAIQAGYPEGVIELLSKNKETVEYVENYAEKKNSKPAKKIAELKKGEIPQLIQWDARWGYAPYGTSVVAVCGCGPTCLSMVFSGLTGDASLTPARLAEYGTNHNYITEENDTKWIFMTEACKEWGISCEERLLEEEQLRKELKAGNPIICSVGPGDFTKIGHFIVLAGYKDGKVIVHDPFSQKNSNKRWEYEGFKDQIKNMWIYRKDEKLS